MEGAQVWGITQFDSESGTEGGYWAVQDVRGINPSLPAGASGSHSYYGLLRLKEGDWLTIYDPQKVRLEGAPGEAPDWSDAILWEGSVELRERTSLSEQIGGLRVHSQPMGVDAKQWLRYFVHPHPCCLRTRRSPWPIGRIPVPQSSYVGVFQDPPTDLYFLSDGSVSWDPWYSTRSREGGPPTQLLRYLSAPEALDPESER